jgi:hypothetical protein
MAVHKKKKKRKKYVRCDPYNSGIQGHLAVNIFYLKIYWNNTYFLFFKIYF